MTTVTEVMEALASPDALIRNSAEKQLEIAQQADFAGFCVALLNELKDETKSEGSRSLAGVVLKNSVALDAKDSVKRKELDQRWTSLGKEIRAQVKNTVLETLASSNRSVRLIASLIIANIARTELPYNQWPQLIDILVNACGAGDVSNMEAALTALGYVCQEADAHENMARVMREESEKILRAICSGMEHTANVEVIGAATGALLNSMDFVHDHMKKEEVQYYLIATVCNTAQRCPVASVRETAMACLVKVAELYYNILSKFINQLFDVTSNAIKKDDEPVALQALLFWITVGEHESKQPEDCQDFIKKGGSILVEISLQCLQMQDEGQTEEDWNISTAGSSLLKTVSEILRDDVVQHVMPFIENNVSSSQWRQREAALMAFGCILEGPSSQEFATTAAQSVPALMGDLQHSHPMVSDTAGWVLACICEFFPLIFTENPQLMKRLMEIIGPMINGQSDAMCIRACSIVHNIALLYEEDDEELETNSFSPYFDTLCQVLLTRIDRPGTAGSERTTATETLNCLIDAAARDKVASIIQLLPMILERLGALVKSYSQNASDELLIEQGLMCGTVSAIAKKIGDRITGLLHNIMEILMVIFQQQQESVLDEGVALIGSLSVSCPTGFVPYLPNVFPVLTKCIYAFEQESLCLAAIGSIGDIASSIPGPFSAYIPELMGYILSLFNKPEVPRDLKIGLLGSIGDIALHCSGVPELVQQGHDLYPLLPYISDIFQIAFQLYTVSTELNIKDDYDNEDYALSLWTCLCEVFSQIILSFKGRMNVVLPYIQVIVNIANQVCRNSHNPDAFAAAVTTFGDIANAFLDCSEALPQVRASLLVPEVEQCINQGLASEDDTLIEKTRWSQNQLKKLVVRMQGLS